MVGCSVLGCKSRSERKLDGITFHSFPSNSETIKKWLIAAGRKNWQPTKYNKFCSIHFDDDSFLYKKKSVQLKPNSVPKKYVHIRVTAGPTPQFELQMPSDPLPAFPQPMIEEIKDESDPIQPDEDTLSLSGELDLVSSLEQSDEHQIIEALVPLSVHPVPLSDAPDPLCEVKAEEENGPWENDGPKDELDATEEHIGSGEENDGMEDDKDGIVEELDALVQEVGGIVGEVDRTVKEDNRIVGVNPEEVIRLAVGKPMRVIIPNLADQVQTRYQEQNITNIMKRCDQALLKVRNMHQAGIRRDTKISSLERQVERLSCFVREQHGERVLGELLGSGPDRVALSKQGYFEMIRQRDETITQLQADVDRLLYNAQDTGYTLNGAVVPRIKIQSINRDERIKKVNRQLLITKHNNWKKSSVDLQKSVQSASDTRQKPLQRTSNSRQKSSNQGEADIPQKSLAGVKRKIIEKSVVQATSVVPVIGNKRKSDIRQNPSIVIHPKLDIRQTAPISDIPQTLVGLQRTSDIRQNTLVIQIDGMHNTVLQPKLVRLDDNNIGTG